MSDDQVERTLEALRVGVELEPADRALEARLVAQHRWRKPRRPLLPGILFGTLLAGTAFAAGGGVEWVRSWWVQVEVDGRTVAGGLGADESRSLEFATETGGLARVELANESLPGGGQRTQVTIDHREPNSHEIEETDDVVIPGGQQPEWIALVELDGLAPAFEGADAEGRSLAIYLQTATTPARLLLHRPHVDAARAAVVDRLPDLPAWAEPDVEGEVLAGGDLAVRLSAAGAFDFELLVRLGESTAPAAPTTLETRDGRVKVRVSPEREH